MNISRSQRRFLIAAGLIVALALCVGALLPLLARPSNCGGNSAALAACKGYIMVLRLWAADHDGQRFRYDEADEETRQDLARLPGASWIRSARLLALIPPEEFARLDLSGFTDLQVLATKTKVEPDGAANGSQPIRSESKSTSSAAGSRR